MNLSGNFLGQEGGQALIEWAILCPLYLMLFIAIIGFGEWFMVKQKLLTAAKEAAFLYSSGRIQKSDVRRIVMRSLQNGHPTLSVNDRNISIGPADHLSNYQLDKVTIVYVPQQTILSYVSNQMEESCVIKHAPPYRGPELVQYGPPVRWSQ